MVRNVILVDEDEQRSHYLSEQHTFVLRTAVNAIIKTAVVKTLQTFVKCKDTTFL